MPRFYCPAVLATGSVLELPAGAARHVQVLRLQPGEAITLFDGSAGHGEYGATITRIGRSTVQVQVGAHLAVEREAPRSVALAIAMPANERMDWLVEKASELGVASIQPLMSERSVLRLHGERATKKVAHWQQVAVAACEQCGGNRVPLVHAVAPLAAWLAAPPGSAGARWLLALGNHSLPLQQRLTQPHSTAATLLCGPEGGLSAAEQAAALACGFDAVSLGARVLRSETAALAALAALLLA
ncbi:MAG: 16S rRNA (uracil(1498)-N(3))-methyltransferase [Rhodoferax sp.]